MKRSLCTWILILAAAGAPWLRADTDIYVDDSYYWLGLENEQEPETNQPEYDKHAKELIFIDEPDTLSQPVKQHPDTVRMRVLRKQL